MITISNGQSQYIALRPTSTKIFIKYADGASGTLIPQSSASQGNEIAETLPDGSTTITGSKSFTILGGGQFSVSASGVSGTITIETD